MVCYAIAYIYAYVLHRIRIKAAQPGTYHIQFSISGEASQLVDPPGQLIVNVYKPDMGYVRIPEKLPSVPNGEWTNPFKIAVTRPPFREDVTVKLQSHIFEADPPYVEFDDQGSIFLNEWKTVKQLSMTARMINHEMKLKSNAECGGGNPYSLQFILGGAIEEFYPPPPVWIGVDPSDFDDDFCVNKLQKFKFKTLNQTFEENITFTKEIKQAKKEEEKVVIEKWYAEYFLIGGACLICILVVIEQFKDTNFDKLIAMMASQMPD